MSRITRNDVLEAFVAVVESTGVEVKADAKAKGKGKDATRAIVFFRRHAELEADGMERHAMTVIVTLRRVDDPSDDQLGQTELLRLSAAFQTIEDAIRDASKDPAGTPFEPVEIEINNETDQPGTQADGYQDDDRRARIGRQYAVTWTNT